MTPSLDTRLVLQVFSDDLSWGRRLYRGYMGEEGTIFREDLYKTVDQRILGNERFVERVREKVEKGVSLGKRRHEFSLGEIARGIVKVLGISLKDLRGKGKNLEVMEGRKLLSLAAREYGYKGREMAEFLQKDPAAVTGYLKDKKSFQSEMDRLFLTLEKDRKNVNN